MPAAIMHEPANHGHSQPASIESAILLGGPCFLIAPRLEIGLDFVSTNKGGAGLPPPLMTESSSRVPRDDARMELCGAGFAFSRSGDLCLFSGFRRNQSRVGGRCGGSVAARAFN
jgi:hypothetical protein